MQITINITDSIEDEIVLADQIEDSGEAEVRVGPFALSGEVSHIEVSGDEVPSPKVLLANRIVHHSEALDEVRKRAAKVWTSEDAAHIARDLAAHTTCIDELERLWETLFGERPSVHDVYTARMA